MVKIYKQPFAHSGDAIAIPSASQPDGKMSSADGWTPDYQLLNTEPNYKPVGRREMNGVFKEVTEALGQVQVQGAASWSADGAPYPVNAQVYHNGKQWIARRANSVAPVEGEDWSELGRDLANNGAKLVGYENQTVDTAITSLRSQVTGLVQGATNINDMLLNNVVLRPGDMAVAENGKPASVGVDLPRSAGEVIESATGGKYGFMLGRTILSLPSTNMHMHSQIDSKVNGTETISLPFVNAVELMGNSTSAVGNGFIVPTDIGYGVFYGFKTESKTAVRVTVRGSISLSVRTSKYTNKTQDYFNNTYNGRMLKCWIHCAKNVHSSRVSGDVAGLFLSDPADIRNNWIVRDGDVPHRGPLWSDGRKAREGTWFRVNASFCRDITLIPGEEYALRIEFFTTRGGKLPFNFTEIGGSLSDMISVDSGELEFTYDAMPTVIEGLK